MKSAIECRERAQSCRALAKDTSGDRRQQTLRMAETWESLARDREDACRRVVKGMLRAAYNQVPHEPVPDRFKDLLQQLEAAQPRKR